MATSKLGSCFNCFKEHNKEDPPAPVPDFKKLPLGGGLHQAALEIHDVLQAIPRFMHDKEERKKVVVNDIKAEQLGVDDGHFSLHVANGKQLWQNWGQSQDKIELEPLPKGLTRYPTRLKDVQTIVRTLHAQHYAPGAASETPKPHLRVVGHGHSWTPIFADQKGDWVIFCREFEFEDGTRIKNAGLAPDGAPLVKITAGVRTGELMEWFEQEENYRAYGWDRPVGLSSDVILDNVRYGGVVANGCHGTGWNSQTVSDMVYSISIVNHEGDLVVYDRNSDPALFNAARCHFGLLGVTYDLTLKLDNDKAHPLVQVDHMKPPQGTYFGPDSGDKLKRLVEDSYAVEIFWFPLTSYVTSVHKYDPMKDRNWMKVFTKRLPPLVGDREPDVKDDVLSTIRDWLRVNIGGAVNWWAYACSKPFLMSLFSGFAMAQLDDSKGNVLPLGRAIHYQKSIDDFQVNDLEFCFKVDADFENVKRAWVEITSLVKKWVDEKGENPLSVAMECRFTAHSDIPLSPAYGKPGDHFCWMEVLSLAGQQNWEAFTDEVARKWIDLGLNPKPHWAKWNAPKDASKPDICLNLAKEASAKEIAAFSQVVGLQDPQGMFQTTWLKNLFGLKSH